METDTDWTPCTEGFPDSYIVLCRNFSTGTDLDSDPCTEIFPDGYYTHFGTDLRLRDPNLNPSPLVKMSHYRNTAGMKIGCIFSLRIHPIYLSVVFQFFV